MISKNAQEPEATTAEKTDAQTSTQICAQISDQISSNIECSIEKSIKECKTIISENSNRQIVNSAYFKLGAIYYMELNNPKEAAKCYQEIVKNDSNNQQAEVCLALACLKSKNYKTGWKYFESRLDELNTSMNSVHISEIQTEWNDIQGKTILVYAERGLGDTIMFARFLPVLKKLGANVLFTPQTPLCELLKQNDLGADIITTLNQNFDLHTSLMSLPYKLGFKTENDIPFKDKYLNANPEITKNYREKYLQTTKFKIGINWQGNSDYDDKRGLNLSHFDKIFDISAANFYSLQTGEALSQLKNDKNHKITDLGSTFKDLSDTAAAIENLDLVITNDTSIAHLAGALGKSCWVLLPSIQDWRWSEDLSYCPWYNSLRLFKQNQPDNWSQVFDTIFDELKTTLNKI